MKPLAERVVDQMYDQDWFSQWLGIERLETTAGHCILKLKIRKEMLNGFGIAHGGITYSLADSALAFASNSKGKQSLSIETSIAHIISLKEGETLIAEAFCETETNKLGHYKVTLHSSNN